jgi:hypothetical protein
MTYSEGFRVTRPKVYVGQAYAVILRNEVTKNLSLEKPIRNHIYEYPYCPCFRKESSNASREAKHWNPPEREVVNVSLRIMEKTKPVTKPIIKIDQGTTESPSTTQSGLLTTKSKTKTFLKLNLGCGKNPKPGYVNVDKYDNPDVLHDLETFPWPWKDNSVNEIRLIHVLEHLGERKEVFLNIIKELYRICVASATIHIVVPHPRHDDFINDPHMYE